VGFKSPAEFREVMDQVFSMMSTDPEMGPKLRDADVPQRFEFPDLDLVATIRAAARVEDGKNLEWTWAEEGWDCDVEMKMDSDVANRYFQGRENVAMAIARRRIKAGGDVKKALTILPITKPVFARYRDLIASKYPHLED
jgi:hypothetical protein